MPIAIDGALSIEIPTEARASASLRPGQILRGSIAGEPGKLELLVAGIRARLDAAIAGSSEGQAALRPGQSITVVVVAAKAGELKLRVLADANALPDDHPEATSGKAAAGGAAFNRGVSPPSSRAEALGSLIARTLSVLGQVMTAGELTEATARASQLLPASLPASISSVHPLLSTLLSPGTLGPDLEQIATVLADAVTAGVVEPEPAREVMALIARLLPVPSEAPGQASTTRVGLLAPGLLEDVLPESARQATHALEARFASALETGRLDTLAKQLPADLRAVLMQLRDDEALRSFARARGALPGLDDAIARVLQRTIGAQLQNLHAHQSPYLFFELPFPPNAAIHRARVHFFGEGTGGQRRFDGSNASIVIDLSTVTLGDLWIHVSVVRGNCTCVIRASDTAGEAAIRAELAELEASLTEAGYANPSVQVTPWDGDQFRETVALMRRLSGISVTA